MDTTRSDHAQQQPYTTRNDNGQDFHDEDILVQLNTHADGEYGTRWDRGTQDAVRRAVSKRGSRSYSARVYRQKSRKWDLFARPGKPGITVDTSFARYRGHQPRQVFPQDDMRSGGSVRKQAWFSTGRTSTRNQGLGITKGTPQPEQTHRANPSVDQSELMTAISMTPGSNTWHDVSPWDRRIPIGISVPTDSISDFSSLHGTRLRANSEATLATPNIVITPAEAMKSVWSPDTPFTESDYTPSANSRYTFNPHSADTSAPPVPALPAGMNNPPGIQIIAKSRGASASTRNHNRNDTLDSNGTAFEEDDNVKRSQRIMSTGTVFEEDETPLQERSIEAPMTIDTSLVPTPRRSQGWWNVITTPFVATPNSAVFPPIRRLEESTPAVPSVPVGYGVKQEVSPTYSHTAIFDSTPRLPTVDKGVTSPMMPNTAANNVTVATGQTQQQTSVPNGSMSPPRSVVSASPGVVKASKVLMPLQVEEQPRTININIELQDRRANAVAQMAHDKHNNRSVGQYSNTSSPAVQTNKTTIAITRANGSDQTLPAFAPPPSHPFKSSHFSYDNGSRCSSPASMREAKAEKQKKDGKVLTPGSSGTQPDPSGKSGWLNLPNYPPIPTGVLTIAQPEAVDEESGCVAPTTLWSCALPKEQQDSVKPNKADQPNFRIQIRHANGSNATGTRRSANSVSAGAFIRSLLKVRTLASPSPAPPSDADMTLLGKTTDGNSAPFAGEETPLSIYYEEPTTAASRRKRDNGDATNITAGIPPPMLSADGTAAAANLLPLALAQPLRLFNRGTDQEYYGFYTYFDRSIFLKQINGTNRGGNPADINGGSAKSAASLRCTFSQTRFLVQIWTRSKTSKPLLQGSGQSGAGSSTRPGTFPYPVTVTLDRHGGDARKKNVYCYHMESDGRIENTAANKWFEFEDRGFGGNLVNGTQGKSNVTGAIDGGTGGCRCQWQNWLQ
ncbi:hypothetical protein ACEQ8H_000862 [Pleosporales sp. CAS-2024a]